MISVMLRKGAVAFLIYVLVAPLALAAQDVTAVIDRDLRVFTLSAALNAAENKAVSVTDDDFVTVWSAIDQARDAYVKAFQDSPIYAFAGIKATHAALRDSINDPSNRAQLEALIILPCEPCALPLPPRAARRGSVEWHGPARAGPERGPNPQRSPRRASRRS